MTHVACEPKLRSVAGLSIHPFPGNWVTTGHAVVYFARAAHAFNAGIKCQYWDPIYYVNDMFTYIQTECAGTKGHLRFNDTLYR